MIDTWVLLATGGLLIGFASLVIGYAAGQALCRRDVRKRLWILFYALDAEPGAPAAKYDVLELIKRLELN